MKTYKYILSKKLRFLMLLGLSLVGVSLVVWGATIIRATSDTTDTSMGSLTSMGHQRSANADDQVHLRLTAPAGYSVWRITGDNNDLKYKFVDTVNDCNKDSDWTTDGQFTGIDAGNVGGGTAVTPDGIIAMAKDTWDGSNDANEGDFFCLQAFYTNNFNTIDPAKSQYLTIKVDTVHPDIKAGGVAMASKNYTGMDVGKAIDITVTFDETVYFMSVDSSGYYKHSNYSH